MQRPQQKQIDEPSARFNSALAKALAPEDVREGDFVARLHVTAEVPSFLWCADAATLPCHEPVRIQLLPRRAGIPLKVKSVCLPFVLVRLPGGERQTLDLRECRLARLDSAYASAAWKAYKNAKAKRRGKEKRK
jgi:hypothetical protein